MYFLERASLSAHATLLCLFTVLLLNNGIAYAQAPATAESPYYARQTTFSVFGAYSGDSSHILMGDAENRKLLDFGVAYGRKLILNRIVNWQYNGELLPVALESDPVVLNTINLTGPTVHIEYETTVQTTPCVPAFYSFYTYTSTLTCTRQWTMGEGISPVGFQWNFLPRHKAQPFFISHGGCMHSTRSIPIPQADSFNFTFDFGTGFELYRSHTRSVRAEYRYHHISNHNMANQNPGIDNGLFQVTYSFGR